MTSGPLKKTAAVNPVNAFELLAGRHWGGVGEPTLDSHARIADACSSPCGDLHP